MTSVETWQAQILCGLREEYSDIVYLIDDVYKICQEYTDEVGWCVSITPTQYIYKNGYEDGAIIGVIQYPRFPKSHKLLEELTIKLAEILRTELKQLCISVVFPDRTIMLEEENGALSPLPNYKENTKKLN